MGERDFYETVRERGDLDPAAADSATLATLSVLGDHLSDTVVEDLASPLPDEAASAFADAAADPPAGFTYEEFRSRVADRLDVDEGTAEHRARAVGGALALAVDDATLADAREQLPEEFDRLFWVPSASEFLATVRDAGDARSTDEAREAATAVLATLGERITPGEAEEVAAYLPDEFATALAPDEDTPEGATAEGSARSDEGAGDGDRVAEDYDVESFVERVAEREGADRETAERHVGGVSDAVARAIPRDEFEDVLEQLPDEYGSVL